MKLVLLTSVAALFTAASFNSASATEHSGSNHEMWKNGEHRYETNTNRNMSWRERRRAESSGEFWAHGKKEDEYGSRKERHSDWRAGRDKECEHN